MAKCFKAENCPFFNDQLKGMPKVAASIKKKYCMGNYKDCARYLVSTKGKPVPDDLFPHQKEKAQRLIN
ncbi:MAG: hypothetical protein ACLFQV_02000 [Vulcanimicrobiota bacterium]